MTATILPNTGAGSGAAPPGTPTEPVPLLLGHSSGVEAVRDDLRSAALADYRVVLVGEDGTGKHTAARLLHRCSRRSRGPFVRVDLLALHPALARSELYGHAESDFADAANCRLGRAALAQGGTLYLEHLDEAPDQVHRALDCLLQHGSCHPVGLDRPYPLDARLVIGARTELEEAVRQGRLTDDYCACGGAYFVRLPALRDRREDILLLAGHFLGRAAAERHIASPSITPAAMSALWIHEWPGNVRELAHRMNWAVVLAGSGSIEPEHLGLPRTTAANPWMATEDCLTLAEYQRRHILQVLERTHGIIGGPQGAARILGLKESTLRDRMRKLGITRTGGPPCPSS